MKVQVQTPPNPQLARRRISTKRDIHFHRYRRTANLLHEEQTSVANERLGLRQLQGSASIDTPR
jgi:hypothetical protein